VVDLGMFLNFYCLFFVGASYFLLRFGLDHLFVSLYSKGDYIVLGVLFVKSLIRIVPEKGKGSVGLKVSDSHG